MHILATGIEELFPVPFLLVAQIVYNDNIIIIRNIFTIHLSYLFQSKMKYY